MILLPEADERVERSVRNLPEAKTLRASYLNVRDLMGFNRLILPLGALQAIAVHLGQAGGSR
ncbi:MAG: 50S ribosomal protein L4 [Chloroflexi bacterium RBG_13_66_10]|nr:MAG: 50S ribosomal protein L4 [Chloroflexi bacterium RBG_13_66_10]